MKTALLALVPLWFLSVESANILVMLPLPLYSHTIGYLPVIKELAKRGHNITMVSPFPQDPPVPNLHDVVVPKLYDEIVDPSMYVLEKSVLMDFKVYWEFGFRGAEAALKQDAVQKVLSADSSSFDLVMTETFFLLEPMAALGYKFKCPVINLVPWTMTLAVAHFTGNHYPSAYLPSVFTTYSDHMNFLQRTRNALINAFDLVGLHWHYLPRQDATMRKYLSGIAGFENLPHISELLYSTSLTLLDTHHSLYYQRPSFKNVIDIGGLTVQTKANVSKELQKYMDDSTQGFIYFSLGSHLPSSLLPPDLTENLFKVFSRMKENVIMKWDDVNDSKKPKNVRIEKWLPQPQILGHPNCKLFVTHGGLHGIQEATHYGVPLVGLPLVADQPINMKFVHEIGIGLNLDIFTATEDSLHTAFTTVLTDPKYKRKAMERSAILRDTPVNILGNAVYHIEYVLRHGAAHLRPPTLDLAWYQYCLLDVVVLLGSAVFLLVISIAAFLRVIKLTFQSKKKSKEKKP